MNFRTLTLAGLMLVSISALADNVVINNGVIQNNTQIIVDQQTTVLIQQNYSANCIPVFFELLDYQKKQTQLQAFAQGKLQETSDAIGDWADNMSPLAGSETFIPQATVDTMSSSSAALVQIKNSINQQSQALATQLNKIVRDFASCQQKS